MLFLVRPPEMMTFQRFKLMSNHPAYLDSKSLATLLISPEVEYVAEDGIMQTCFSVVCGFSYFIGCGAEV